MSCHIYVYKIQLPENWVPTTLLATRMAINATEWVKTYMVEKRMLEWWQGWHKGWDKLISRPHTRLIIYFTKVGQKLQRLVTSRTKYPMQRAAAQLQLPGMCSEHSKKILLSHRNCVRPTIHFSHFTFRSCLASVFAKHTTKYGTLTIHFLYFMRISCFINTAKK